MGLALLLYCVVLPIILIVLLGYDWHWIWKLRAIPGPSLFMPAFSGHLPFGPEIEYVHYKYLGKWPKQFGPVYRLFFGQKPYIVVSDPVMIEQICTRQFTSFYDRVPLPFGARVTKDDHLQFASNIFWAKGGKSVNIIQSVRNLAMSNLGKANFGVDFDCMADEPVQLTKEAFYQMDPPPGSPLSYMLVMFLPVLMPRLRHFFYYMYQYGIPGGKRLFEFAQSEGYLNGTTKALIKNVRRGGADPSGKPAIENPSPKDISPYRFHQLKGQAKGSTAYKDKIPSEGSFVPKLVEAKIKVPGQEPKSLTDLEIVAQAYTMIIAGVESPANAMANTIFKLAMHPAAQAKVIEEVDSLGPGARPGWDDMPKLPYTEACFQEALRLHPVGNPMFSPCRVCTKDTEIGGYKFPRGVGVMLNSYAVVANPKYFPDPEAYKPERHIPGTPLIGPETRPPAAHMPFGYGPHGCIGRKFALEQAVLFLVRIFQQYTLTIDEHYHPSDFQLRPRTGITFQPDRRGLWLKLHPRAVCKNEE